MSYSPKNAAAFALAEVRNGQTLGCDVWLMKPPAVVLLSILLSGLGCAGKTPDADRNSTVGANLPGSNRATPGVQEEPNYGPLVLRTPSAGAQRTRQVVEAGDADGLLRLSLSKVPQVLLRLAVDFQELRDGSQPLQPEQLAVSAFVWPGMPGTASSEPQYLKFLPTSDLSAHSLPLDTAQESLPPISMKFSGSKLVTIYATIKSSGQLEYAEHEFELSDFASPLPRRSSQVLRQAVDEDAVLALSDAARWSKLNYLSGWAVESDARKGIAARQLEWLLLQASVALWRLPADLEEAKAAAGLQLINLVATDPGKADIEVAWDGHQAFLFTQRFDSGVETQSVLFFHGIGGKETRASWTRPETLWEKAPQREWQPFAAYDLVSGGDATIPMEEN